jgi:hypothetical protein
MAMMRRLPSLRTLGQRGRAKAMTTSRVTLTIELDPEVVAALDKFIVDQDSWTSHPHDPDGC